MNGDLIVGIDPGVSTGFAVYDPRASALVECTSGSFWDVWEALQGGRYEPASKSGSVSLVVVEDARCLPIYARRDAVQGRRRDAMCRNVGGIDRETELWERWLLGRGYGVQLVQPVKAKKWDADFFQRATRFQGRTNQHARDAARLVWGRSVPLTLFEEVA